MKARRKGNKELLEQRVLGFIKEHNLVSRHDKLLVAVSGGVDSICLLHILTGLQEELGIKLHVAHLNHQLRGDEANDDARYVVKISHHLNIPAIVGKHDVKAYQVLRRTSLEEAAREVRYNFLAGVAESVGTNRVAAGHTSDDHIETILMHLVRGTGTKGLCGLQPSSRWQSPENSLTIIRPLLPLSREETSEYCRHHKLMPRSDTSNQSLSPLRNRIRLQLVPLMKSYNQQVTGALLRTAQIACDTISFFDRETAQVWDKTIQEQGNTILLDKSRFIELPLVLKQHLLRRAIEKLLGNLRDIEMRHIEQIVTGLSKPAGKKLNLPRGLIFYIDYDKYLMSLEPADLSPFPVLESEFQLKVPGETHLPGWCISATIRRDQQEAEKDNQFTAYFDLDRSGKKLTVRPRRPGDRFQPLGMKHNKKLGKFMIDAKVPCFWRKHIPVVCSPEQILWLVSCRIDDRVKVSDETKQVLCLKFERH